MAKLFQVVAGTHGVTDEQVRGSLAHRRTGLDLAIILSFAVLYAWTANIIARRIWRQHAHDNGPRAAAIITVYASAAVSAGGVFVGEVWSEIMESIRLGTGHLSYREERIPWTHHRLELFISGVLIFWVLATLQRRAAARKVNILGQAP